MHVITQNCIIAQISLKQYLLPYGYVPVPITPGLCKNINYGITFVIAVDNLVIKG